MEVRKLIVKNDPEQLELIQDFIEKLGPEWELDSELVFKLNLILEEYINNLISYGFTDRLPHEITLELVKEASRLSLLISDDGNPFDITDFPEYQDFDKPLEERRIGGLGIHFIKTLADKIDCKSDRGVNKLTLVINL